MMKSRGVTPCPTADFLPTEVTMMMKNADRQKIYAKSEACIENADRTLYYDTRGSGSVSAQKPFMGVQALAGTGCQEARGFSFFPQ
jgi:hypothetical protein